MARRKATASVVASFVVVLAGAPAVAQANGSAPAPAARDLMEDRYIVLMDSAPAVAYEGGEAGLARTAPRAGGPLNSDAPRVRRYVEHLSDQHREALEVADVPTKALTAHYAFALNGFAAELSAAEAGRLRRQDGVVAVMADRLRQPQTDNSPHFLGLDRRNGPWARGYDGEGVVVGVIDTGIWPEHPSFADDGTFPEPTGVADDIPCDFGTTPGNPDDAAFECNNKLIGARDIRPTYEEAFGPELYDSARDANGHGTHTASTAAGNAEVRAEVFGVDRGTVSGIAPRAHVVAYKAGGELGFADSDTALAVDQAVADGVDVLNYSIGGGAGSVGAAEIAFLFANQAGVFSATSAGNDGPGAETVGSPGVYPWVTTVGASTQDRAFQGEVTLGNGESHTGASITAGTDEHPLVDAEDLGNELCLVGEFTGEVSDAIVLCRRGENARVEKSQAVFEAGGAGMVLYDVSDEASLVTDNHWVPSVHVNLSAGEAIKAYIDSAGAEATASIQAGEKVRAQGSVMADFSSRGPNVVAPDIIVPDVTAPGVNILAGNTPTPSLGAPGQLFQSISGTSMSSPHVAGVFAMLKQVHPDWSPAAAKSALMTSARQNVLKEDGATRADPFDRGAGHITPGRTGPGSPFQPGVVYDAGVDEYLGFLCGVEPTIFADPEGTCSALEAAGVPTEPSDLNLASIGVGDLAGTQTVTRTMTSVADRPVTYRAKVRAPRGYRVQVQPARFTLRPGQSKSVEITITNRGSAEEDAWRFGSLTWKSVGKHYDRGGKKGSGYRVYSPIAVRAVALNAPEEVAGSGTEGTVEVPVTFGYTGDYAALSHGLVASSPVPGEVAQDPDQNPFTGDDGAGLVAHEFDLTDAAAARWRLTLADPPGVDLDVYVAGPDGEIVAASTVGGTNELVTLTELVDGTYTVYVHGWQTGGTVSYEMDSWVVPSSTDGTLTIQSAPDAATLGESAEVVAGWTGVEVGEEYLGLVSHNRGDTLLQHTLVAVTG